MQVNCQRTPLLNTPLTEPLCQLQRHFLQRRQIIDAWFEAQWQLTSPPVYGSVDLRNAGFKLAPIDMNLFPAGFNNLNPNFLSLSVLAAKNIINRLAPQAKSIVVITEGHTRNLFYWASVSILQTILEQAGFQVKLGTLDEEVSTAQEIVLNDDGRVIIQPLRREDNQLLVNGTTPDLILLNNDLSQGIPTMLHDLKQPLIPPAELGWSARLKSDHFQYYAAVTTEFAKLIDIDPWLIAPLFRHCGQIDFMQQEGMECLTDNAEKLFAEIQQKYAEYHIPHQPFLIVKADSGTYGMAVMTVRNVDELKSLNRKQRTRMATTKGGQPVHRVIIQEGVYTFETVGESQAVAEPVVYLWGCRVVGGFYRVHKDRGVDENLNAPGMHFEPLAFSQTCDEPCLDKNLEAGANRFYLYGIVAQLSMLAAAREIKDQAKK